MARNLRFGLAGLFVLVFSLPYGHAAGLGTQTPPTTAVTSPAAATAPKLHVKPDHDNGVYGPEEKVTWTVDVIGNRSNLTALPYEVKEDGQVETSHGTLDLSAGPATITASRATPGVLLVQIFSMPKPGEQVKVSDSPLALGGAVISPGKITPAIPPPGDFDAFWQGKLKELSAVPVNAVEEKGDVSRLKSSEGLDYYKVTLDNIRGTHVRGQLARPKNGGKFPAMLMVQYAGVYPLDKEQLLSQAKDGWLVFNISAHDLPIDEQLEYYTNIQKSALKGYPFIGDEDRETSYFLRMFLGCARAVEYLKSRSDWDGKTLLVRGASQGGLQAFVTAALCPEVTAVNASVPAGCDMEGPLANPPHAVGWPYWISDWGLKGHDVKKVAQTAGYYDGINFAARVHCPTLVSVGLIDVTARPTGIFAAYNSIPASKKLIIMPLRGHHADAGSQNEYDSEAERWKSSLHDGAQLPTK